MVETIIAARCPHRNLENSTCCSWTSRHPEANWNTMKHPKQPQNKLMASLSSQSLFTWQSSVNFATWTVVFPTWKILPPLSNFGFPCRHEPKEWHFWNRRYQNKMPKNARWKEWKFSGGVLRGVLEAIVKYDVWSGISLPTWRIGICLLTMLFLSYKALDKGELIRAKVGNASSLVPGNHMSESQQ